MVDEKDNITEENSSGESAIENEEKTVVASEDRRQVANLLVDKYAKWSFGIGFIPVPAFDLVALTGTQMKMLHEISQVYGYKYLDNTIRNTVGALLGSSLPQTATNASVGSFIKSIPVFGTAVSIFVMPTACAATTYAIGNVFIKHFESGGTFLDIDLGLMKSQVKELAEKYRKNKDKEKEGTASA
jgi:uncharacterized protein (DUF697 family)